MKGVWKNITVFCCAATMVWQPLPSFALAPSSSFSSRKSQEIPSEELQKLEQADLALMDADSLMAWYARTAMLRQQVYGTERMEILHVLSDKLRHGVDPNVIEKCFFTTAPRPLEDPVLMPKFSFPIPLREDVFTLDADEENIVVISDLISFARQTDALFPVGFSGAPGAGKTDAVKQIVAMLEAEGIKVQVVDADGYLLSRSERRAEGLTMREKYDQKRLAKDIVQWKAGEPFMAFRYDYELRKPVEDKWVDPKSVDVLIFEGEFVMDWQELRDALKMKIFADEDPAIRYSQVLERDTKQRGDTAEDVAWRFATAQALEYLEVVYPQAQHADIVWRPSLQEVWVRKDYLPQEESWDEEGIDKEDIGQEETDLPPIPSAMDPSERFMQHLEKIRALAISITPRPNGLLIDRERGSVYVLGKDGMKKLTGLSRYAKYFMEQYGVETLRLPMHGNYWQHVEQALARAQQPALLRWDSFSMRRRSFLALLGGVIQLPWSKPLFGKTPLESAARLVNVARPLSYANEPLSKMASNAIRFQIDKILGSALRAQLGHWYEYREDSMSSHEVTRDTLMYKMDFALDMGLEWDEELIGYLKDAIIYSAFPLDIRRELLAHFNARLPEFGMTEAILNIARALPMEPGSLVERRSKPGLWLDLEHLEQTALSWEAGEQGRFGWFYERIDYVQSRILSLPPISIWRKGYTRGLFGGYKDKEIWDLIPEAIRSHGGMTWKEMMELRRIMGIFQKTGFTATPKRHRGARHETVDDINQGLERALQEANLKLPGEEETERTDAEQKESGSADLVIQQDGKTLIVTAKALEEMAKMDAFVANRDFVAEIAGMGLTQKPRPDVTVVVDFIAPDPDKVFVAKEINMDETTAAFLHAMGGTKSLAITLVEDKVFIRADSPEDSFVLDKYRDESTAWAFVRKYATRLTDKGLPEKLEGLKDRIKSDGSIVLKADWEIIVSGVSATMNWPYLDRVQAVAKALNAEPNYPRHFHPIPGLLMAAMAEKKIPERKQIFDNWLLFSSGDIRTFHQNKHEWFEICGLGNPEHPDNQSGHFISSRHYHMAEIDVLANTLREVMEKLLLMKEGDIHVAIVHQSLVELLPALEKIKQKNWSVGTFLQYVLGEQRYREVKESVRGPRQVKNVRDLVLFYLMSSQEEETIVHIFQSVSLDVMQAHEHYATWDLFERMTHLRESGQEGEEFVDRFINRRWWLLSLPTETDLERLTTGVELLKTLLREASKQNLLTGTTAVEISL